MKAIVCTQFGTPDDLQLADVPEPKAGAGEAVVAIKAAALNFFDILQIQGKYQVKPPFPFTPGAEAAGVVDSVGVGVTRFSAGDRVLAMPTGGGFPPNGLPPVSSSGGYSRGGQPESESPSGGFAQHGPTAGNRVRRPPLRFIGLI